jgi:hypothetical protein
VSIVMRIIVLFPKDSKKPGRGFREEVFEVPQDVVRDMFETYRQTKNVNRAVDVICEWIVNEAARKWCRSMGRPRDEECIEEYLNKQGERIIQQCVVSVRKWIADVAVCLQQCGRERNCLEGCIKEL